MATLLISLVFFLLKSSRATSKTLSIPLNLYNQLNPGTNSTSYKPEERIKEFTPEMAMYYSWFASIAYCSLDEIKEGKCCSSMYGKGKSWELVDAVESPNNKDNTYLLFKSDVYKKILFAFPGAQKADKLITQILKKEIVNLYKNFNGLGVNEFFREKAFDLIELIKERNGEFLKNHQEYQFIFTGHSMGGSIATIISYLMIDSEYKMIDPNKTELVLLTFGQPRTGNPVFGVYYMNKVPHVFRVVRNGDIVSLTPFCQYNNMRCNGYPKDTFDSINDIPKDYLKNKYSVPLGGHWHIGGQIMINTGMTEAEICDPNQGEEFEGGCKNIFSLDIERHLKYFSKDKEIGKRCLPK